MADRLGRSDGLIVGRDEPATVGLGLGAHLTRLQARERLARVCGAGNAMSGATGYYRYRRLTASN